MGRVASQYLVFSTSWILASDWMLDHWIQRPDQRAWIQSTKGLIFVLASACFLCWLFKRFERQQTHSLALADQARQQTEEHIQRLANFDTLTGLPNRSMLAHQAHVVLTAAARQSESAVLMHINIDHFGAINETWGHTTGDDVLIEVAHRLTATLPSNSILSRSSGDDFILLGSLTSPDEASVIARRVMQCMQEPLAVSGQTIRLTCSVGIAAYPDNGATWLELTQAAEAAVHQAKREGRNQFQFYSTEQQEYAQRAWRLERALHQALAEHQLSLHYQPQVDIHSERLIGLEALIRWHHPEWGWISPAEFIPIAEESGLIREIGHWVISTAIEQNARWREQGFEIVPVAVNLSLSQFKDRGLCDHIEQSLRSHNLPPHLLELELTESVAMADSDYTIATIDAFKQLGVALAIDDFGTGYSCLSYLKRFAVDKLKVDQSFVRGLNQDPHDEAIVKTIINLAKSLGLQTIAEGVETREQLTFLRQNGCDQFQGYLRSRPLPPDQLRQMLAVESTVKPA